MTGIVERLRIIRAHLRTGALGQREAWEEWLTEAADDIERLRTPRFDVVQLQPDEDSPGLWIGFETAAQRAEAMKLFALKDTKP